MVAHVETQGCNPLPIRLPSVLDGMLRCFEPLLGSGRQQDVRTKRGQELGHCKADSTGTPCNVDSFILERFRHIKKLGVVGNFSNNHALPLMSRVSVVG
jgi:hypothetical protein